MISAIDAAEKGWLPDSIIRYGIRRLLVKRLVKEQSKENNYENIAEAMSEGPLALETNLANDQHYEVPSSFFEIMLGEALKYSCGSFEGGEKDINSAEQSMLEKTIERAGIAEGMNILELGCGWGSLTFAMTRKFPSSRIMAVSNSNEQREFIEKKARDHRISNIAVLTCDMNNFTTEEKFDRIVSIEMFEHMRNYALLFERISSWLSGQGRLFFHIFCHKNTPYFFQDESKEDWMAKHFFSGGVMPAFDLPTKFESHLSVISQWQVNGFNYARTLRAWLERIDSNKNAVISALSAGSNPTNPTIQFQRWRLFLMACEELFAYNGGEDWFVGHYLCEKSSDCLRA